MTAIATTCPHCKGTGDVPTWVQWSDGLGGSSARCPICDGNKTIDFDPVQELAALKTRLASFLYKAWLVAGCKIVVTGSTETRVSNVPSQSLCNDLLRDLQEFPAATHESCVVPIIDARPCQKCNGRGEVSYGRTLVRCQACK